MLNSLPGSQRSVPSTLQVGYTGDRNTPIQGTIDFGSGNQFLIGSSFTPDVSLLNALGEAVSTQADLNVSSSIGTVEGNTVHVSSVASSARLFVEHGGEELVGRTVRSTDTIRDWGVPAEITAGVDERVALDVSPKDGEGTRIRHDGLDVQKEVVGNIGRIDSRGRFAATRPGEGEVIITIGEVSTTIPVVVEEPPAFEFTDVSSSHPNREAIYFGVDRGFFQGHSDGTFRPSNDVARQQIAAVLVREFGLVGEAAPNPGYVDVRESHPSFDVIAIATEQGWIQGRSSTNEFNPGNNLTRGQMALILTRAYGLEADDTAQDFTDVSSRDPEQLEAIRALSSAGITTGYSDGTFRPGEPISRGHFAEFMKRLLDYQAE
ncbi:S-layer homology domain-containing protein [Geomicrobium sp. JCM 19039]|uniref:S-layer homology domain-containing protein n=1 Tax=Geomicrobium sp. JCM 19039 TaxID=1460636 RepID=UPI00045F2A46|nr:S-layer homology domain-containing protein [Geomicrobium sp. JCM 19039]GAK11611.1 hypothetical protein JCM19039_1318 [Geomicrobium sp. JCM 19039]